MRHAEGRNFQGRVMGNSTVAGAGTGTMRPADYIGITENATAPTDADTALVGELTLNGFARALATFAMTAGATSYTLTKTFTSSDPTPRTAAKMGVFNAPAAGSMPFSNLIPAPQALSSGDQLTLTESVGIA